jgi:hypothetical protein
MESHRPSIRRQTNLAGRILTDKGRAPIECTVRDLSDGGARIEVRDETLLPYEFELEVPDINLLVRTRVAWTSGNGYGLMFIAAPQMTPARTSPDEPMESVPLSGANPTSLTLHLTEVQHERLRRFAFEQRMSYHDIVESALRDYLNRNAEVAASRQ